MSKPLSLDLRERVVAAASWGMSHRQAAERFGVSAASVIEGARKLRVVLLDACCDNTFASQMTRDGLSILGP